MPDREIAADPMTKVRERINASIATMAFASAGLVKIHKKISAYRRCPLTQGCGQTPTLIMRGPGTFP